MRPSVVAALLLVVAAARADGQVIRSRTAPPSGRDTVPGRQDSIATRRDTIPARRPGREAAPITWVEDDSVARALEGRRGYTTTRYQGPVITFDAPTRALELQIAPGDTAKVAVERENRLIVADSSITYSETNGRALATGGVVFREGETNVTGVGGEYNLRERSVVIRGGRTQVQTEENWFVSADILKAVQADSLNRQNFFGRYGNLTSCDLAEHGGVPHYHFAFKELKRTAGNTMVARPAVLYIADIPVMWLPFVFQDMRPGRHSGLLTPRLQLTDFVRNSPSYQRHIENVGWYWAISDYMDLQASLDWYSNATRNDARSAPGFTRYAATWRYNWLDRFLNGSLGVDYLDQVEASKSLNVSWYHNQEFTRDRRLNANVNWVQNTQVRRQTTINPYEVLATISSRVNLQDRIGPARVALGADRTQYSGRKEVQQTFPNLSITTGTLNLAPWLTWTPSFSLTQRERRDITQPSQLGVIFRETNGVIAIDSVRQNERTTNATFDTPIEIFGYSLRNAFRYDDREFDAPQLLTVVSADSTIPPQERVFARTYQSSLDWTPSFALPTLAQGTWNISPSVSLANVYGSAPFMVRSQLSGGEWVRQGKRPTFGLGIAPTFYGLFPGFWGFTRFRHAITPRLSYAYAPRAGVSDEFLLALNQDPRRAIGAIPQNQITLGLATNLEGKGHPAPGDSTATAESAPKATVLSLNFSPLTYDVSRYQKTREVMRGLTTSNFLVSATSDLLPGADLSLDWSLFQGDNFNSDTAVFRPYLTRVSGGFQMNARRNPFALLTRIFGRAVPANEPATADIVEPLDPAAGRATAVQPIAGSTARQPQVVVPPREGWEAAFTFSSSRQRPPRGGNVIAFDPTILCEPLRQNPFAFDRCVADALTNRTADEPVTGPQAGSAFYRIPPTTSIGTSIRFLLTPKWTGSWQTNYDVERGEFASHIVQLQRDLHDWRATFSFTQAPTGSFAFSFFIALKAEPDLKFDYNRSTYRREIRR